MARTRLLAIPILAALTLFISALPGRAADEFSNSLTLHLPSTLSQLTSFDISYVDSSTNTYVLTDRNNKNLEVFDSQNNRFVRPTHADFTGLGATSGGGCKTGTGPNTAAGNNGGPNGVVIISGHEDHGDRGDHGDQITSAGFDAAANPGVTADLAQQLVDDQGDHDRGRAWAGDGNSTVKVVDLNSGALLGSVSTGGTCRADELGYDPADHDIMIGNPNDSTVFETFISTNGTPGPVLGKLIFDGGSGCTGGTGSTPKICHTTTSLNGIEQPIYALGHFWVAIGSTGANAGGEVAEIDPDKDSPTGFQRVAAISVPCGPSGLAFIPPDHAAAACGAGVQFLNLTTLSTIGSPVANSGGADEIWFANGNVYAPDSNATTGCARSSISVLTSPTSPSQTNSCLAVVNAGTMTLTDQVQLPADAGSHSVAADSGNHEIFVPVKDLDCSTSTCPPAFPSVTPCPVSEDTGGCIHDQGIAVITLDR